MIHPASGPAPGAVLTNRGNHDRETHHCLHPAAVLPGSLFVVEDTGSEPQQVLADGQPDKVQVTLADGSQLVLEEPAVSGDTLSGLDDGTPVHIPLANVSSIAVKGTDGAKTGLLVFGVVVVAAAVILVGAYGAGSCSSC